jgi:hypothetical protein
MATPIYGCNDLFIFDFYFLLLNYCAMRNLCYIARQTMKERDKDMKKILITTAAMCFAATTVMAATAAVPKGAKRQTPVETGATTGAKITGQAGVKTSGVRTNVGATTSTATQENVLSQSVSAALGAKLEKPRCDADSVTSLMNSAQFTVIARAKELGLTGSSCFDKFKGSDVTIANRINKIADSFTGKFEGMAKSGQIRDVNGDNKVTVADANDTQKAQIISTGASVLAADLQLTQEASVDRLQATKENGCDIVGEGLGTSGAFSAARSL